MRYAMRIAEIRETLDFRTHSVPRDSILWHTCFSVPDFKITKCGCSLELLLNLRMCDVL